jgi:hypothetical protein
VAFGEQGERPDGFDFSPPTNCPGPWSKAILVVELSGPRPPGEPNANIRLLFGDPGSDQGPGLIFMGSPQEHGLLPAWRVERDVTEIASIFTRPQRLFALSETDNGTSYDPEFSDVGASSIKLMLFHATTRTPAPHIADVVMGTSFLSGGGALGLVLPRNIERAYVDVYAQVAEGPARLWYSCVSSEDARKWPSLLNGFAMGAARGLTYDPDQGCAAGPFGAYREVEVFVDGERAGLAPVFPWLPSNIHNEVRDTVDYPAPSTQALNMLPSRVDLTPFAARLSDGLLHHVLVREAPSGGGRVVAGQLLLYLDHGRAQVTGALTQNTLATQPATPTVQDGLAQLGNTVSGTIDTQLQRQFVIQGYVDTSHGRITSRVSQASRFANLQTVSVTGMATQDIPVGDESATDYYQKVQLSSSISRTSRRMHGTTLLSEDREHASVPLTIEYHFSGVRAYSPDESLPLAIPRAFDFTAHQARLIRTSHYRRGMPRYDTDLADSFNASRSRRWPAGTDSNWDSTRRYLFTDSAGSCYSAALTTLSGVLQTRTRGTACPDGTNAVRWYAHTDGSPDAIGWGPPQP